MSYCLNEFFGRLTLPATLDFSRRSRKHPRSTCQQHLKELFCTLSQSYGSHEMSNVVTERYHHTHKKLLLQLCATKHPEHGTEERVLRFLCPHPLSAALVNWQPTTGVIAGGFGLCLPARLAVGSNLNCVCPAHTPPRACTPSVQSRQAENIAATSHQQCWCALLALQIRASPCR